MKLTSTSSAIAVHSVSLLLYKGKLVLTTLLQNIRQTFLESGLILHGPGFQWKNGVKSWVIFMPPEPGKCHVKSWLSFRKQPACMLGFSFSLYFFPFPSSVCL